MLGGGNDRVIYALSPASGSRVDFGWVCSIMSRRSTLMDMLRREALCHATVGRPSSLIQRASLANALYREHEPHHKEDR